MEINNNTNVDLKIIGILNDSKFHSGESLSALLNEDVSRAAISKRISNLKENYGLVISSVKGKGYRLMWPVSLYNSEVITSGFSPLVLNKLKVLEVHLTIESTNNVANEYCKQDEKLPALVISEHQSAGRGRSGNKWVSPLGQSIYYSLAFNLEKPIKDVAPFALLTAIAVSRTLNDLNVKNVDIKWPNDVLIFGNKLSGILIEAASCNITAATKLVVGIGLNYNMHSSNENLIDRKFTDISSHTDIATLSKSHVVSLLTNHLFSVIDDYDANGFLRFFDEYSSLDVTKGKEVILSHKFEGTEIARGLSKGISQCGGIRIQSDGVEKIHHAGEISLKFK